MRASRNELLIAFFRRHRAIGHAATESRSLNSADLRRKVVRVHERVLAAIAGRTGRRLPPDAAASWTYSALAKKIAEPQLPAPRNAMTGTIAKRQRGAGHMSAPSHRCRGHLHDLYFPAMTAASSASSRYRRRRRIPRSA